MEHIVIIGNGIAGVTAARHIRKLSDARITIISGETEYFFSRTALMYVYMGHMKFEHTQPYENHFWKKNRIELKKAWVTTVSPEGNSITMQDGETMEYSSLILATGSNTNKFGWPGQDLDRVQGLVTKMDLQELENNAPNNDVCKSAVLVGGGLIGVEFAEMLATRKIPVTFLIREKGFWSGVLPQPTADMIADHVRSHGIDLHEETEMASIQDDGTGKVASVTTKDGKVIPCDLVGLCAGVHPNIQWLEGMGIETDRGILVDRHLRTNHDNIYAIGDCAQQRMPVPGRKPVEAVWYTGRMMGETVAQTICGNPTEWNPGHWFNSAKFFDIEYQTYGWVFSEPKEGNAHYHWMDRENNRAVTFEYEVESRKFIGVNTFGIRMRHETFDTWLTAGRSVDFVAAHLEQACFNPEFFDRPFKAIAADFQAATA